MIQSSPKIAKAKLYICKFHPRQNGVQRIVVLPDPTFTTLHTIQKYIRDNINTLRDNGNGIEIIPVLGNELEKRRLQIGIKLEWQTNDKPADTAPSTSQPSALDKLKIETDERLNNNQEITPLERCIFAANGSPYLGTLGADAAQQYLEIRTRYKSMREALKAIYETVTTKTVDEATSTAIAELIREVIHV